MLHHIAPLAEVPVVCGRADGLGFPVSGRRGRSSFSYYPVNGWRAASGIPCACRRWVVTLDRLPDCGVTVGLLGVAFMLGSLHRLAHDIAPLADLLVANAVDGLVFPEGGLAGSGQGEGVPVVGDGVYGEEEDEGAVVAVHPEFQGVGLAFDPEHGGVAGAQFGGEDGLEGVGVEGLFRADDVEGLTDGVGVAGVFLDAGDEGGGALEDAGRNGGGRGAGGRGHGEGTHARAGAIAGLVLEGGPLLAWQRKKLLRCRRNLLQRPGRLAR